MKPDGLKGEIVMYLSLYPPFDKGGSGLPATTPAMRARRGGRGGFRKRLKIPLYKGGLHGVNYEGQVLIAATPDITQSGLLFVAGQVFP